MLDQVLHTLEAEQTRSLDGLKEFLRIPSVSTKLEHADDCQRCARWLAERFAQAGLTAEVMPTGGHPVVLATTKRDLAKPTVLLYGHYDVQPPEPLEQWLSPPFEPTVREGAIFARGAADDKGQVWCHLQAIRAWQRHGGLPVNLIAMIEGEEEIGSANLEAFFRSHAARLKADVAVISDTGQFARGVPAITCGLRGLVYMEVVLTGPDHDLHSGIFGGSAPNPANILCQMLSTLHDREGRVNIPGFYDDVVLPSKDERHAWARLPFDDNDAMREMGVPALSGEAGFSTIERRWVRPTCDINGLTSGYQGAGAKTIIPARASAKVSMRLVPNQDPQAIQAAFEHALRSRCPNCASLEFRQFGLARPVLTPIDSSAMKLAAAAVKTGFGAEPVFMREGGTIPVVSHIKSILGIDTLLVGFGLPDDRVHSPNEKFDLEALRNGTRSAAALYGELARL
jgi:acetylornithine deacetylase/succinyl-diaminopimelate desuccinylase-like protein